MLPKNIPEDINVELLLSYFAEGSCKVAFKGLHKRNAYKDIISIEEQKDNSLLLEIGRNSLYNSLPEAMFHSIDRFDNIPKAEEKERFAEEYQKQEQEKENAYKFFAPIDLLLLKLRVEVRKKIEKYVDDNRVLIDMIADGLTENQKTNRFISQVLTFLPSCKIIRGNTTLLTFMLRKVFMEEGLRLDKYSKDIACKDDNPRYADGLGGIIDKTYLGNIYYEETIIYDIHYWSEEECNENFLKFVEDVEEFQLFIQDYFISIEETIRFDLIKDEEPLRLADNMVFNYLNYNTNL